MNGDLGVVCALFVMLGFFAFAVFVVVRRPFSGTADRHVHHTPFDTGGDRGSGGDCYDGGGYDGGGGHSGGDSGGGGGDGGGC